MSKGGSAPQIQQPDYMAQANAQMKLQQQQAEQDRVSGRQSSLDQDNQTLGQIQQYNSLYEPTFQSAEQKARDQLSAKGLNFDDYGTQIDSAIRNALPKSPMGDVSGLSQQLSNFDTSSKNPLPFVPSAPDLATLQNFDPTMAVSNTLNNIESGKRSGFNNDWNSFAPTGFESNFTNSKKSDAQGVADSILGTQFDDANSQILAAKQRGSLSDIGYNTATKSLGNQRSVGESTIQSKINDILNGENSTLSGIGNTARTGIGNYTLGSNFGLDPFKTQVNNEEGNFSSGLEGNVRSSLAGNNFFDVGSLLNQAGTTQGVSNGARPLFDAFAANEAGKNKQRGLGEQGAF